MRGSEGGQKTKQMKTLAWTMTSLRSKARERCNAYKSAVVYDPLGRSLVLGDAHSVQAGWSGASLEAVPSP